MNLRNVGTILSSTIWSVRLFVISIRIWKALNFEKWKSQWWTAARIRFRGITYSSGDNFDRISITSTFLSSSKNIEKKDISQNLITFGPKFCFFSTKIWQIFGKKYFGTFAFECSDNIVTSNSMVNFWRFFIFPHRAIQIFVKNRIESKMLQKFFCTWSILPLELEKFCKKFWTKLWTTFGTKFWTKFQKYSNEN